MHVCVGDSGAACSRTSSTGSRDACKSVCDESDRKGVCGRQGSIAIGSFLPAKDRTAYERDTRSAAAWFASCGRTRGSLGPITEATQDSRPESLLMPVARKETGAMQKIFRCKSCQRGMRAVGS